MRKPKNVLTSNEKEEEKEGSGIEGEGEECRKITEKGDYW